LLCTMERRFAVVMGICLVSMFGVVVISLGIRELMKRMKLPRNTARNVTLGSIVVLSFAVTFGISFSMMELVQWDIWEKEEQEYYEVQGMRFEEHHDELPLYVQDLVETDYDHYSCQLTENRSLLISRVEGRQDVRVMEQGPELNYTVYEIHLPLLYNVCKEELFFWYDDWLSIDIYGNEVKDQYIGEDPAPWGAEEAYRLHNVVDAYNWYLLCYEDRLITIQFDWEPTDAHKQIVAEKLGK